MATLAHQGPINERRNFLRRASDRLAARSEAVTPDAAGARVSWSGLWAGILVALGVLLLLTTLGLAIGISSVDTTGTESNSIGTSTAIWATLSLLLAYYLGGMASTRLGAYFDRTTATLQGSLVWILTTLLIAYLAGSGVGLLAGGAFKLFGGATQTIGSLATSGGVDLSQGSVDEIVQRLKDPQVIATVAAGSGVPEDQVRARFLEISNKVEAARQDPAQAAAEVREGVRHLFDREGRVTQLAERAKAAAARTAWLTLAGLVLSLIAAVLGARTGRRPVETIHREAATI